MPVPSAISDLSATPGLNSPSGSESPASIDDYLRTHAAFIRQVSDASVKTSGAQTIDGAKTFSSPIVGSITGNAATAASVTGTVAIVNGGTGQTTAAAAFGALKQDATETATGVVELATAAEAQAGTDTTRALTPARLKDAQIQRGTAVTLTNQTAVDFTGIPSWARRVTVMLNDVSTNGAAVVLVQVGSGSVSTSGYNAGASVIQSPSALAVAGNANGVPLEDVGNAVYARAGALIFNLISGNVWVVSGVLYQPGSTNVRVNHIGGRTPALAGALDRIRLTTANGTDQFDGGSVNIAWE